MYLYLDSIFFTLPHSFFSSFKNLFTSNLIRTLFMNSVDVPGIAAVKITEVELYTAA